MGNECKLRASTEAEIALFETETGSGADKARAAEIVHRGSADNLLSYVASQARFELTTFPLGGGCSIQLSYWDTWRQHVSEPWRICHARPAASDTYIQRRIETAHLTPCSLHDFEFGNLAKRIKHRREVSVCI